MSHAPEQLDSLTAAHDRAKRLWETLKRQEAELAADTLLDPVVRDAGLRAVRCAAECAGRLVVLAEQAKFPGDAGASAADGLHHRGPAR